MLDDLLQQLLGGAAMPPNMMDPDTIMQSQGSTRPIPYPFMGGGQAQSSPAPDTFGKGGPTPYFNPEYRAPSGMGVAETISKSMAMPGLLPHGAAPTSTTPQAAPSQGAEPLGAGFSKLFGSDFFGRIGPALMMASGDPNYMKIGAGLLAQSSKTAETQRQTAQTYHYLIKQGVSPNEAAILAGHPTLLSDWYKSQHQKPEADPTSVREYEYAKRQGYNGSLLDFMTSRAQAGATKIDMNQNQGAAAGYADRMYNSERMLRQVEHAGTDFWNKAKANIPIVGNFLTSDQYKEYEQAQRDWVNAKLRQESGAVISESEFDNARKQYFPQPGDTPEVIAQKRQNRAIAMQGMARQAGSHYTPPELVPPGVKRLKYNPTTGELEPQ